MILGLTGLTARIVLIGVVVTSVGVGTGLVVAGRHSAPPRAPDNSNVATPPANDVIPQPVNATQDVPAAANINLSTQPATTPLSDANVPTNTSPRKVVASPRVPGTVPPANTNTAPTANTNTSTPTNTNTNTNTSTPTNTNTPPPPIALHAAFVASGFRHTGVFTYTTEIFQGDTVTFDASSATGAITSYEWDFGDGTSGSGQQVSHRYNADPSLFNAFNVRLTVRAANGSSDQTGGYYIHYIGVARMLVRVEAEPTASANRYVCGQTIHAKAWAYSPWGDVVDIRWSVLEGNASSSTVLASSSGSSNVSPDLTLPCNMGSGNSRPYTFRVDGFKDSAGNWATYVANTYYGYAGTLVITAYAP